MKSEQIRPIIIRVLRDGDRMFVAEYHDPWRGETFYRSLGRAIEFELLDRPNKRSKQ